MVSYFGTKVCKLLLLDMRDLTGFEKSGVFTWYFHFTPAAQNPPIGKD